MLHKWCPGMRHHSESQKERNKSLIEVVQQSQSNTLRLRVSFDKKILLDLVLLMLDILLFKSFKFEKINKSINILN